MRRLIQFFIERTIWTNASIVIIILFGFWSLSNLNRSFFPEIDPNRVLISVLYPGASPQEMEDGVSLKIEQAIKGLKDIEFIEVNSQENIAQISIKAEQDADMEALMSDIENSVNAISSFPLGAEKPIITRLKTGSMSSNVAFVGVIAKDPNSDRYKLAQKANQVEQELLNTKVITQIVKQGFPETEIAIQVREQDLNRYNITFEEIATAVALTNNDITAGVIRGTLREMNIRANQRVVEPEEIAGITLRTLPSGEKIIIGDVASVTMGFAEGSEMATYNNLPSISLQIQKTTDEDIAAISEAIQAYQKTFNERENDYAFEIFFEFNNMLNDRIRLLSENGLFGLILVLLALGLFLNIKLSAWVAFGIPFSFLGMFIFGYWFGITINMISLFGMILVVGILVDDGIVIAENIYAHFEKGKKAHQAAIDGTMEVLPSVFTSVLTTILAFSVLLFVEGLEIMREMAFVVIACLAFSLFEAFFVLPSHLASKKVLSEQKDTPLSPFLGLLLMVFGIAMVFIATRLFLPNASFMQTLFPFALIIVGAVFVFQGFSNSPIEKNVRRAAESFIRLIRDKIFRDTVNFFLSEKRILWIPKFTVRRFAFFIPLIFTFSTFFFLISGKIGFTFFPAIPPDFFNIEVAFKPGDPQWKTTNFLNDAANILLEENDRIQKEEGDTMLAYFTSTTGATMNLGQAGNHVGMINVYYNSENTKTPVDTFINRIIRRVLSSDEGKLSADFFVGGFNRFGADIEFGLSSDNNEDLEGAKKYFKNALGRMNGVQNIKDNAPPGRSEVYLTLLPQAEIYGLGQSEIVRQIRNGFFGREAQRLIIGNDEVKIWVRYPPEDRQTMTDLANMQIRTAGGLSIPLSQVATFKVGRGPESLKRRDSKRQVKVDATSIYPDSVASYNRVIKEKIIPEMAQIFPSVSLTQLGQAERSQKTGDSMQYITIIVLVVMLIVISLHFLSVYQAFLILLVIPAGIAGAILGHGIVGIPVSLLSAFGMIALLGVLINDAVVFLDKYNQLITQGATSQIAAYEAAIARFRPILLTTITTVAGLLPLISEKSMQAQFLIPMATSIAFGVLFGTLIILAFFPAAILFGNDIKRAFTWLWTGKLKSHQEVETALAIRKAIKEKSAHDSN